MARKNNIGLVTWTGGYNYGTVLQAYALNRVLLELGDRVEIIRHYSLVWGIKLSLDRVLYPLGINILRTRDDGSAKIRKVRAFQKKHLKIHKVVGGFGFGLARLKFDRFVCGSDQIWNTRNAFDPFLFLDFTGKKDRISYAASIGNPEIEPERRDSLRMLLSGFKAISVREESARIALTGLTGRDDIVRTLDPTLLLNAREWCSSMDGDGSDPLPDRYALVYVLRRKDDYDDVIRCIKEARGLDKVFIIPSGEFPDIESGYATVLKDTGPEEFIRLFRGASFVLTDSFHGTAFSINFNVDFACMKRFDDNDPNSQNSRIYDMLRDFGIGGRFFDRTDREWLNPVAWDDVNARLEDMRQFSFGFLRKNLCHE